MAKLTKETTHLLNELPTCPTCEETITSADVHHTPNHDRVTVEPCGHSVLPDWLDQTLTREPSTTHLPDPPTHKTIKNTP